MQGIIVDCSSGQDQQIALSPEDVAALGALQGAATADAQASAAERAWRQTQLRALAAVGSALHDGTAGPDAAALAALVHKLVADPVQPLSALELGTLARFVLRCLLP